MYDIQAIKGDANPLDVARFIDMEIKKHGSRYYIRCPKHEEELGRIDKHIDNCVLTKWGYRCFSCGSEAGVIDMVMYHLNCSFYEALGIVADSLGGREKYLLTDNKKDYSYFPLSVEELKLIGLYPYRRNKVEFIVNAALTEYEDDLPSKRVVYENEEEEYLYYRLVDGPTIYSLYEKDRELCEEIIRNKVYETIDKIESVEILFLSRESLLFPFVSDIIKGKNGYIEEEDLFKLKSIFTDKKRTCEMILANLELSKEKVQKPNSENKKPRETIKKG